MQHTRPGSIVEACRSRQRWRTRAQLRPFVLDYLIGHVHLALGDPVTAGKYLDRAAHKAQVARAHDP